MPRGHATTTVQGPVLIFSSINAKKAIQGAAVLVVAAARRRIARVEEHRSPISGALVELTGSTDKFIVLEYNLYLRTVNPSV